MINVCNARYKYGDAIWAFNDILGHMNQGRYYELQIIWDTIKKTWYPLNEINIYDFMSGAVYAHAKGLIPLTGWKWSRKYTKNPRNFIRWNRIFKTQAKHNVIKYIFGILVTRDLRKAYDTPAEDD